jgi:hypothetical protein
MSLVNSRDLEPSPDDYRGGINPCIVPETCMAFAVGAAAVAAGSVIISGSIVVTGNTIHWLEYQGTCSDGYLSNAKEKFLEAMNAQSVEVTDKSWMHDANGCRIFNSYPHLEESVAWTGACVNGYAEGLGKLTWFSDGKRDETDEGLFHNGKLEGHAVMDSPVDHFEGEFKDGVRNGYGISISPDGKRYEGEWKDGKSNGHGVITWKNGKRFEGEFTADKWNGHGVLTYASGNIIEGDWVNDVISHVTKTWVNGDKYVGDWKDNLPNGKGFYKTHDGEEFNGTFTHGCYKNGNRWVVVDTTNENCGF